MKKHLYNSRWGRVRWFVDRFGWTEVALKPLRMILSPVIRPLLPKAAFEFAGQKLALFYHPYNITWASERCVEVPVARSYAEKVTPDETLEIGNVLSHYGTIKHTILDKFEKAPGVINEDIIDFVPSKKFKLIISISTFEHIGFDDEQDEPSPVKISRAIQICRKHLKPGGVLVLTLPMGYNPELDQMIGQNQLGETKARFLWRREKWDWIECNREVALAHPYRCRFPYANAVMIAEFAA